MPVAVRRAFVRAMVCAAAGAAFVGLYLQDPAVPVAPAERGVVRAASRAVSLLAPPEVGSCEDGELDRAVLLPTGEPTSLSCDDARQIVAQARATIAAPALTVDSAKFAEATADWLDPHGMWSVAPDAPPGPSVRRAAERLLAELEAAPGSGPCRAALEVGAELQAWAAELRRAFDEGQRSAAARSLHEGHALASATPFEDGAVTRSARDLARELGRSVGGARAVFGPPLDAFADAARQRAAPALDDEGWSRVVIAAAVRSYVPQLDAHGAWAPLDEEMSIYDLGLESDPPQRLWSEMTRTALGLKIDHGAMPPLADGDVVLAIHDIPLAGVSVEQAEQFAIVSDVRPVSVTVLRAGATGPTELAVVPGSGEPSAAPAGELRVDVVRYADGKAAVVTIADVPDDLGARLASALDRARRAGDLRGVLLDVRANGGGSTDGAIGAIGLFLPGAALFPMRRRDGGVELETAPDVGPERRWSGPVGVLVDGDSASAAEMIAGAISAYRRGLVVGARTYGKGCAQEYLDDDAHAGVLRLTTLLFALPDGSPVQKVGVAPNIRLSLPQSAERESLMARALGPWHGPDVRDPARIREVPWPSHGGRVGPCVEETACRALRALGASPAAAR